MTSLIGFVISIVQLFLLNKVKMSSTNYDFFNAISHQGVFFLHHLCDTEITGGNGKWTFASYNQFYHRLIFVRSRSHWLLVLVYDRYVVWLREFQVNWRPMQCHSTNFLFLGIPIDVYSNILSAPYQSSLFVVWDLDFWWWKLIVLCIP